MNTGIELEASWQVHELIDIYGSWGILDTEFTDFINADGKSLNNRQQAHAPNYQFNVGVNFQASENWLVNFAIDGKDGFYFSDSHNERSKSVVLVNASLSYLSDDYQVKIWARNLTDENYANRGFYFGNDPRDGYTDKQYSQLSEPLVFGITVDYQF